MTDRSLNPHPPIESGVWIESGSEAPFIALVPGPGGVHLAGQASTLVGHRMRVPDDPRPRGLWGEWAWDGETLTAQVDPLGFFSLFVFALGDRVMISPSILQLLAQGADPAPDPVAMAVFHPLGFFVGNDTPFRHIRVLSPGGRLTWRAGVLRVEDNTPTPSTLDVTREQAVDAIIESLRVSIRRFLASWDGPIGLPLSGGRDSRHVLLEMLNQGRKPDTCVTFHHGGRALNAEVQAASAVAARANVRHAILGHPRMRLRDSLRGILMTQLCSDEHAQMMPMHDFFAGSAYAAIDGIGGDILTTPESDLPTFMERAQRDDFEGNARSMATGHGTVISRHGYKGGAGALFSPDLEEAAIDRIALTMRAFANWPDSYQAFWFWNRTRREISFVSTAVLGGAAMVSCPYLDPDFVALGLSLPWAITCDQKLHDDAIARAYPRFADIPFAEAFTSQPLSRFRASRFTNIVDTLRVAAQATPGNAMAGISSALRTTPLERGPSDVFRLHSNFVGAMNATEARRLIALDQRLRNIAPKGEGVVSDVHRR